MEPIHWTAQEYTEQPRSNDWYWALGILAVAGAATAFIIGNILFAVVIALGAFVLTLYARKKPKDFEFEINGNGIAIGSHLYPYRTLESFCIPEDGTPRIIVHSKRLLVPQIVIPVGDDVSLDDIYEILSEHIEEDELSEPFSERLAEWFGF